MRYLITFKNHSIAPFITAWFQPENHFVEGMTIYDLATFMYSTDGITWSEIQEDHL